MTLTHHVTTAATAVYVSGRQQFARKNPAFMLGAMLALWIAGAGAFTAAIDQGLHDGIVGQDAHAYWNAAQGELVYDKVAGQRDAYLYSPVFLTLISPLTWMPYPAFLATWIGIEVALLLWLLKPLHWKWAVPLFMFCVPEIIIGNVLIMLATAVVLAVRHPAAWAFPILTKITTGAGFLWFAARGEWRRFFLGGLAVVAIVAVSYAFDPAAWHAWVEFLLTNSGGTPHGTGVFAAQCLLAVTLVIVGARTSQPWLLAPALWLGMPVLVNIVSFTLWMAIPRLLTYGDELKAAEAEAAREMALEQDPQRKPAPVE